MNKTVMHIYKHTCMQAEQKRPKMHTVNIQHTTEKNDEEFLQLCFSSLHLGRYTPYVCMHVYAYATAQNTNPVLHHTITQPLSST
jgi:hypothetical protein